MGQALRRAAGKTRPASSIETTSSSSSIPKTVVNQRPRPPASPTEAGPEITKAGDAFDSGK